MSAPARAVFEAETLARTVDAAFIDRGDFGATIRPIDYQPHEAAEAIPETRASEHPSVTLSDPTLLEHAEGEAALEVLGSIGEGGMGRVLLARQRSLGREVAVKLLKVQSSGSLALALLHEGRVLGLIEHPNVVPVYALGSDEHGQPALVMKRIDGVAWSELIRHPSHPFWAEVRTISADRMHAHVEILMQVAQAVHFAHERGVLHRDIKADNVIVGRHGEVYLADWGIAVRKDDLEPDERPRIIGTPTHLAPEMARGIVRELDERTDVYLLGATLHEVLTAGRGLHAGAGLPAMLISAMESAPPRFDEGVPPRLAEVCTRATRCDPAERYPSALAFRAALAETLRHAGSIALTAATRERQRELHALVETGSAAEAGGPEPIYRLLSECRFGYAQALREWPDNEDAARRLSECIECVARFELAAGRPGAARGLISELADPPADLREALERIEERAREDEARKRELERIAADVDTTRSAGQYARFFGGLGALVVAIFAVNAIASGSTSYSPAALIASAGSLLAALVAGTVLWRRRLFDSQASRGVIGLLLGAISGVVLDRVIGLIDGTPPSQIVASNAAIGAAFCIGAALLVRPWFAWLTGIFIASAFAAPLFPEVASVIFAGATTLVLLGAAGFWWRDRARAQRDSVAS